MGVALVVVAAVLTQVISFFTYYYTRRTVEQQTTERTHRNLKEMERINNLKARVESAITSNIGTVEECINNPKDLYDICVDLVNRNKHIIGSAIALRPGSVVHGNSVIKSFAAFAYQAKDDGIVMTKHLPYDYQKAEWYERPMAKDSVWWSEPYKDTGGSDMLIYTFSAPIHNNKNQCIGVFTGDINYKEMVIRDADYEDTFQRLGIWILISQIVSVGLIIIIVWR